MGLTAAAFCALVIAGLAAGDARFGSLGVAWAADNGDAPSGESADGTDDTRPKSDPKSDPKSEKEDRADPPAQDKPDTDEPEEVFVPSEDISEDIDVPFPVDI